MNMFRSSTLSLMTALCLVGFTACKSQFEAAGLAKKEAPGEATGKIATGEETTGDSDSRDSNEVDVIGPGTSGDSTAADEATEAQDTVMDTVELDESERAIERAVSEYFLKVADRAPGFLDVFYQPQIFLNTETAYMNVVVTDIQTGTNFCYELLEEPLEATEPRTLLPVPGDLCADPQDPVLGTELKMDVACLEGDWKLCERYAFLLYSERLEPVEIISHIVFTGELSAVDWKVFGMFPQAEVNPNAKETFSEYLDETAASDEETIQNQETANSGETETLETPAPESTDETATAGATTPTTSGGGGGGGGASSGGLGSGPAEARLAP